MKWSKIDKVMQFVDFWSSVINPEPFTSSPHSLRYNLTSHLPQNYEAFSFPRNSKFLICFTHKLFNLLIQITSPYMRGNEIWRQVSHPTPMLSCILNFIVTHHIDISGDEVSSTIQTSKSSSGTLFRPSLHLSWVVAYL